MTSDPYLFSTDTLPDDRRFLPPLANGLLGWRVYSDIMHVGGIYNGEGGKCHRADVPCPLAVELELGEEPVQHTYTLDAHSGSSRVDAGRESLSRREPFLTLCRPVVSNRHLHARAERGGGKRLAASVRAPALPQPDGDGGGGGATGDLRGSHHRQLGQFLHASECRHRFPARPGLQRRKASALSVVFDWLHVIIIVIFIAIFLLPLPFFIYQFCKGEKHLRFFLDR